MAFDANVGFDYPYDIHTTLEPWRDKLGGHYDGVVARLLDRDRALENKLSVISQFDQVDAEESTNSTSEVDLTTPGPIVNLKVPTSGQVIINGGAYTTVTADGATAIMALFIDGALHGDFTLYGHNAGGSTAASLSATLIVRDLSPGRHEFRFKYATSNAAVTVRFAGRFMLVTPVA